eukprot:scaffold14290_cov63-Phaeocystis_antarctica.AAC.4
MREEATLAVGAAPLRGHRLHVVVPLGRAPVAVDGVVEHVAVDRAERVAVLQRRRRHQPRGGREAAEGGQHERAIEQRGEAQRRAQRRGLAQQAGDAGLLGRVAQQPQRRCRGVGAIVGGRVELPELRLSEAVALVIGAHHPIVLHDERRAALALDGPLHKVLEAVGEEARVHHRDAEVGDQQLGEDLVERLLVVLLGVARLVVEDLLEEDDGPHARTREEEAGHDHARCLSPRLGHHGTVTRDGERRLRREDRKGRADEHGVGVASGAVILLLGADRRHALVEEGDEARLSEGGVGEGVERDHERIGHGGAGEAVEHEVGVPEVGKGHHHRERLPHRARRARRHGCARGGGGERGVKPREEGPIAGVGRQPLVAQRAHNLGGEHGLVHVLDQVEVGHAAHA